MERTSQLMILNEKNLGDYRAWLKEIREKVRAEKGRLTEAHLIGELVSDQDALSPDINVSGAMSSTTNGADDKWRRRIRHLDEFADGQARNDACRAYGQLSIYSLGTKAVATMSEAAMERALMNHQLQSTAYHEREDYLCNLLNEYTAGTPCAGMNAGACADGVPRANDVSRWRSW